MSEMHSGLDVWTRYLKPVRYVVYVKYSRIVINYNDTALEEISEGDGDCGDNHNNDKNNNNAFCSSFQFT